MKRRIKKTKVASPLGKFPGVTVALAYARDVIAEKIPACRHVVNACTRHFNDLKRKDLPWRFDEEKAERAIAFIEKLPHTKGRWAARGERTILSPWQKFVVAMIFGWVHSKTGLRRFREVYLEVPRKNGKSHLAACIGLYMLVADGEFGAEVYSGATTEKQAWEIFRPARLIAVRTDELVEASGMEINAASLVLPDGSRFAPVVGNPGDGASPSCALVDEFHEHDTPALYDTMETGMGSREQPLLVVVTTAGANTAGPCYLKRGEVIRILDGTLENDRLFGIIYTLDEDDDWTTEAALRKANPNYGISVGEDYLLQRQRAATQSAVKQNVFKTKHLNVWVGARAAWMNMEVWNACPRAKSLEELAGRHCYVAFDLASKIDIASMVAVFPPEGDDPLYHVHNLNYLPEDVVNNAADEKAAHYAAWAHDGFIRLTPGNVIDFEYIKRDFRDWLSRFEVREAPCDPYNAMQFIAEMAEEGAPIYEFGMTTKNLSEPMKQVEAWAMQKLLAHPHNPALTWMVSNVVAKIDANDNLFPRKEHVDKKIDAAVALIAASARAMAKGNMAGRSFWETQGEERAVA